MHLYGTRDRVQAEIPGGVIVVGPIVGGPYHQDGDDRVWYVVEQAAGGADDGHRYDVRENEVKVVLND